MIGIALRKTVIALSIALALGVAALTGCQQNAALRPTCEVNNTGKLRVQSYKGDPYRIYVNNAYRSTVGPFSTQEVDLTPGTYATRYVQASGYILYPTEYTLSVTIQQCNTITANIY